MPPFLIAVHDVAPLHAHTVETMLCDLAPLVGRSMSLGIVPNWHGDWPLAKHPEFCELVKTSAEELLLHGYVHHRRQGFGWVSLLAEGSDEMNGLGSRETKELLERGQQDFLNAFGTPAQGFLAPAWQIGRLREVNATLASPVISLGYFTLRSGEGQEIPLATFTWDCGRFAALGHVGDAIGQLLHWSARRVPVLAIHPRDVERGFWPRILRLTNELLTSGYAPTTCAAIAQLAAHNTPQATLSARKSADEVKGPGTSDAEITV